MPFTRIWLTTCRRDQARSGLRGQTQFHRPRFCHGESGGSGCTRQIEGRMYMWHLGIDQNISMSSIRLSLWESQHCAGRTETDIHRVVFVNPGDACVSMI